MEMGKVQFNKRTGVIVLIAVLIGVIVALSATCVWLVNYITSRNNPSTGTNKESGYYTDIGKVIAEIEKIYDSKYVRERGDDYKSRVINGYLSGIGDAYAYYYTAEEMQKNMAEDNGNSYGIGVMVAWTGNSLKLSRVMKDSPAAEAGLMVGDDLKAVNGESFDGLTYSEALSKCRGEKGDEKNFVVERGGETLEVKIICGDYTIESVFLDIKEYNGVKIGVIECTQFIYPTPTEIKTAVETIKAEGCEGIIFDMRDNPGGLLDSVVGTLDYLLPEGTVVRLTFKDTKLNESYSSDANYATDLPFAVLVNGNTASAGELFTSCIKDFDRAKIIGTTTYGKGCGQTQYALPDGGYIKLTTFFYDPPTSENYDGVGIVPDIVVELPEEYKNTNISLIPEGSDTQMIAALDYLTGK